MDFEKGIAKNNNLEQKIKKDYTVAIIPARGGSKSIPKKNIKLLNNKPLIYYTIKDAQETSQIQAVYVSSDNEEILEISQEFGSNIIKRPISISGDIVMPDAAIMHALLNIMENKGFLPEYTVMLQPTSPLRETKTINKVIKKIKTKKYNSVISVVKTHHLFWEKNNDSDDIWVSNYAQHRPRRQDFFQYTEDGSIYVFDTVKFLYSANRIIHPVYPQEIDQKWGYEIDTPVDWIVMEALMKSIKK